MAGLFADGLPSFGPSFGTHAEHVDVFLREGADGTTIAGCYEVDEVVIGVNSAAKGAGSQLSSPRGEVEGRGQKAHLTMYMAMATGIASSRKSDSFCCGEEWVSFSRSPLHRDHSQPTRNQTHLRAPPIARSHAE